MDMKKILQALDGASTKPVEGSNDMKRFLRAVTEADVNQPGALPAAPKFYITQTTYNTPGAEADFAVTNLERGVVVKSFGSEQEARQFVAQADPAGAAQTELHQVQSKATAPEANPDATPQAVGEEIEDLGNGAQKKTNPDGTYEIGDGSGLKLYSANGKLIKTISPTFNGFSQETDVATGNVTQRYNAGPMSTQQTKDKTGKVISTKATADLGLGTLGYEKDRNDITTKSWAPRAAGEDPITQKDMYALGNKDKEATYDRAMKQVAKQESVNLDDVLKLSGILTEGKNTKTNRLSTAEQIAVQHYTQPETKVTTNPVLNKPLKNETLIKRYVEQVLAERAEELEAKKAAIKERAARVVKNMREGVKVTKVDPAAKTVTYTDDTSNVTTTVPQTMVRPGEGGKVAVDKNAAAPGGIDQQGSEIKPGMDVEVSEISPDLRSRYAQKARTSKALSQMNKAFKYPGDHDKAIAKRDKGLGMVKTRTDKIVAAQREKAAQDAIIQRQQDKENLPQLKAQLEKLKSQFDPNYEYSDDHSFWSQQRDLKQRIHALQSKIHDIGEGDE